MRGDAELLGIVFQVRTNLWPGREVRRFHRQRPVGYLVEFPLDLDAEVQIAAGPHAADTRVALEYGTAISRSQEHLRSRQTGLASTDDSHPRDVFEVHVQLFPLQSVGFDELEGQVDSPREGYDSRPTKKEQRHS